jgi:hypothetical protein
MDLQYWDPGNQRFICLLAGIVATLGNVDLLANFARHENARNTCLMNLVAGNMLAILCLSVSCLHQFQLLFPMCEAFWLLRDIATGVQVFSVVVLSVVRLSKLNMSPENNEAVPTSPRTRPAEQNSGVPTTVMRCDVHRCISASSQTLLIWMTAIYCSSPRAVTSEASCFIQDGNVFEDSDVKRSVIFHCLAFCIGPLVLIIFLHVLTEFQRRNIPDAMKKDDSGKLVFWLVSAIFINYIPLYSQLLYSWSQHTLLTMAVVDFLTYFPLYSTACWIPVVLHFVMTTSKTQFNRHVTCQPFTNQNVFIQISHI